MTNRKSEPCIHHCGRFAETKDGECRICRSGFYYWKKQPATKRLKRRNQLDVLSSRLDTHFDTRGKVNPVPHVQREPHETSAKIIVFRERKKA